ncbi:hypothetical protein ABID16_002922 [Rhizobium aquaticum]|uniref:Uncharacterized protein n=1 Tax=Rhizobium aquaticum TaxID=1549636 RepID=A0ABV2J3M7_9HYPH
MTRIRTLFAQSALAAALAIGAAGAAHADIATYSTSISAPSANAPSNAPGNTPSAETPSNSDVQDTKTNSGGNGGNYNGDPFISTYNTQIPNRQKLPKEQLLRKKPCRGPICKTENASMDGEVCFYTGVNFTGAHFCATIGTSAPSLPPRWNDRIASVEVKGLISAKVCSDRGYSGQCLVIDASHPRLFTLNREISSYTVRR